MLTLTLCLLALCTIMLTARPVATASLPTHAIAYTVDLNAADARMLSLLPGIGPGLAAQIIAHREQHGPFASEQELLAVPRIGPLTLARIQPWLHINPPPQAD